MLVPDLLDRLQILKDVAAAPRARLLQAARLDDFRDDDVIFAQGDEAQSVFVVIDGFVKIVRIASNGEQTLIHLLGAGRMIAEAFAVGGGVHSTGAAAVGNTTVARIPARVLRREASETPSLALALLSEAQKKTAILMDVIESLKVQSADERVSRYILSLCPRGPTSCAIRFPYHKRVVAELLGIQQATLSRSLARLRALGVATDARVISVASVPRLRASLSGAGARAMDAEQRPVEHA